MGGEFILKSLPRSIHHGNPDGNSELQKKMLACNLLSNPVLEMTALLIGWRHYEQSDLALPTTILQYNECRCESVFMLGLDTDRVVLWC